MKNIFISGIIYSTKADVKSIRLINDHIFRLCNEYGFVFIDNNEIGSKQVWKDGIHLKNQGISMLANNFIHGLNTYFLEMETK